MIRKLLLTLCALAALPFAKAQLRCSTDETYHRLKQANPAVATAEALQEQYLSHAAGRAARGTNVGPDTVVFFDIPVVFHIVHDYGVEYLSDTMIYRVVDELNKAFNRGADYSGVVPPFAGYILGTHIRYIANARIRFHLATIDPLGRPTNGITRYRSRRAYSVGDDAKYEVWPTDQYLNIWSAGLLDQAHQGSDGYAYYPAAAAVLPGKDGIVMLADYLAGSTLEFPHLVGHYLNLEHPWGDLTAPEVACGDDGVDDTPPTKGHNWATYCDAQTAPPTAAIWDTVCAVGYIKAYTAGQKQALLGGDSIPLTVNYPDTANTQNYMDEGFCPRMFTYGQGVRMRNALFSPVAGRNLLWDTANLAATGAMNPVPDLPPVADFNPTKAFVCAGAAGMNGQDVFRNYSWRDTVSTYSWTFSNAIPAASGSVNPAGVSFSQPGWADVSLTATSNAGSSTITKRHVVYAADTASINADGYYQEFDGADTAMYPIFNYYNDSNYQWERCSNAGYYDQHCIRFRNYDPRAQSAPSNIGGSPDKGYADFFTRALNLSDPLFSNQAILSFYTAGAYRTSNTAARNDTLEVTYSTTCGNSWTKLLTLNGNKLASNFSAGEYHPAGMSDWTLQGIALPLIARSGHTFFRFRYKPGVDTAASSSRYALGTGNHFYLDRINISPYALGMNAAELTASGMALYPNPTSSVTTLVISGKAGGTAQVTVSDMAGQVVYRAIAALTGPATQIELPAVSVKGMYLVQVAANGRRMTRKLVVL